MIQSLFIEAHIANGMHPYTVTMQLDKQRITYQFLYYGGVRTVYKETGSKHGINYETYGTTVREDKIHDVIRSLKSLTCKS